MLSQIFKSILFIIFFMGFCVNPTDAQNEALVWKGCGITRKAFMSEAAKKFEEKTGIKFKIVGGGATLGIRTTIAGSVDIGGTCRHPLPDIFPEEQGGVLTQVAWDAIVFITHPDNPIVSLTEQQVKDIFMGKINNWKDVGGENHPIVLVYRHQTQKGNYSGVGYMLSLMMFNNPEVLFKKKALSFRDSGLVESHIENDKWAFAATGISSAKKRKVKILKLDNIFPSKENIVSAKYKYFRPLFLITKNKPEGEVKMFIDWILSPEGQTVISEQGTVNLSEGKILREKFQFWK